MLKLLQQAVDHSQFDPLESELQYALPIAIGLAEKLLTPEGASLLYVSQSIPLIMSEIHSSGLNIDPFTLFTTRKIIQNLDLPPHHFTNTKLHQALLCFELFQTATVHLQQKNNRF